MISSEEFQQKLQAGRLHEALALVVRDTTLLHRGFAPELDVTTRLTQELANSESSDREYLRTKINLLTGDIQNEIGKDVVTDSTTHLKLQKLHIDQIVASHRIVQGYLDRFKAILTVLAPSIHNAASQQHHPSPLLQAERMDTDTLVARLHEATGASPIDRQQRQSESMASNAATFSDEELSQLAMSCDTEPVQWQPLTNPAAPIQRKQQTDRTVSLVEELEPMDDEIDLSIDEDGAVWEEWVEDEDFLPESSSIDLSSASPEIALPAREEPTLDPRQLHPIELKPTLPRTSKRVAVPSPSNSKFRF
ncbi:hypothetical protein [Chamaesiphon minutus]|uniref:Uncharacterized protein n=1 Tax=Chamaesiphon minutus (strain ATCC 27169 / PCC 6605) TaxID=1173020 RepID=K9UMZ7_CHAP6|nr:hypothetical protein [Chamaesiphon minutus]AFY95574.1 hypothetical protein Cha6605_4656 [Chamaesiphon minutus PCC 6605]